MKEAIHTIIDFIWLRNEISGIYRLIFLISGDRSLLSLNFSEGGTKKTKKEQKLPKLPPRPADYDDYWYQDDDGTWRNEYDDEGKFNQIYLKIKF